jgi:hypothetical protein
MTPGPLAGLSIAPGAVISSARRKPSAIGSDNDARQRTSSSVNHLRSASLSSPAAAQYVPPITKETRSSSPIP